MGRAEIVEEEPFEESIPHPKTLVGSIIVNYVNNEVYPQMDLRTNFTMKTKSNQTTRILKTNQTQTFHSLLFSGSVLPLAIGANLSLLKNFVDFRKIEFRWWVGIDKLG